MNKHIELVKKWLANPESVTRQELKDNRTAYAAYAAKEASDVAKAYADDADEVAYAVHADYAAAVVYAAYAADAAYAYDAADAAYWVKRYEELREQE